MTLLDSLPSDCEGVGGSHRVYKTSPRKLKENMFEFIFSSHISPSFFKKILCISLHFLLLFDHFSHSNTGGLDLSLFFFQRTHTQTQRRLHWENRKTTCQQTAVYFTTQRRAKALGNKKKQKQKTSLFSFFASILLAFKSLLSVCFAASPGVFLFCGEGVSLWHIQCKDETYKKKNKKTCDWKSYVSGQQKCCSETLQLQWCC